MKNSPILWQAILPTLLLLVSCGQQAAETAPAAGETRAQAPGAAGEAPAMMPRSASAPGARVFFITPADGDVVTSPVKLEFGLSGMDLVPAGEQRPNSGHHHLIIDSELPPFGQPVPKDDQHVHFGDASSNTEIVLAPGRHTLQLLFADYLHIPHDPPVYSEKITITVE
jgi:Domain of unknown function (DUF4399)